MDAQVQHKPYLLTRTGRRRASKPERVEVHPFQEQFIGPVLLRNERPAAELLRERLAEGGLEGASPLFIP